MIRFIEDKTENYRGNRDPKMCFLNTTNSWFTFDSQMTYATFKSRAKDLAEYFGATEVMIIDLDDIGNPVTVCRLFNGYKFYRWLENAKTSADRIYYEESELKVA